MSIKHYVGLISGVSVLAAPIAWAQPDASAGKRLQLEEVVVTAQKRTQSLSDVPVSVTALSGDKLTEAGIENLSDLSEYTPNFKLVEGGLIPNVYMRGVGSGSNQGFELSVGIFSDGIHLGRPHQTRGAFMDLERVDVLRGPQSILFGKNAIAGALSLISARPTEEPEYSIGFSRGGPDDQQEITATASMPLTDAFGVRVAVRARDEDGYMENVNPGLQRSEPNVDEFSGRIVLAYNPNDMIESTLKLEKTRREQIGRQFEFTHASVLTDCSGENTVLDNTKNSDTDEYAEIETYNGTLNIDVHFDRGTLSFVSSMNGFDSEDLFDADSSSFDTVPLLGIEKYDQLSHEIRFASPGGEFVDYIAGVFYQKGEMEFDEFTTLVVRNGALADSPSCDVDTQVLLTSDLEKDTFLDSEAYSAFVQTTFNWNDAWRTTLGVRFVTEEKYGFRNLRLYEQDGTLLSQLPLGGLNPASAAVLAALNIEEHTLERTREVSNVLPSVNVQWDATDSIMTYVTATKGAKSGSFDLRGNNANEGPGGGATNFEFDDEEADAYEVGAKMTLAEGTADLNIALYYVDYQEMQVSVFDGVAGFVVTNAGSALTEGVEVDGRWLLSEWFMLSGSLAYLDFEWTDYKEGPCKATDEEDICDLTGKQNQQTPKWTGSVSGHFTFPLPANLLLDFNVDVSYRDEHFTSGDLDERGIQPSYTKINSRLAVSSEGDGWSVALVGKNLTDERTIGIGAPSLLDIGGYRATAEPPRAYFIEGRMRF